jgi:hypothetical protein
MTIAFMGLFVALLSEALDQKPGPVLLAFALLVGFASVVYWHFTDDLRFYRWVQRVPLLTIPVVVVLFRGGYSHRWLLLLALGFYLLAKLTETYDREILAMTHRVVSGHTVKHVFAAGSCLVLLQMLRKRRAIGRCR